MLSTQLKILRTFRFPIPMRGNEAGIVRLDRSRGRRFPIPMRGNEYLADSAEILGTLRCSRSP